MPVTPIQSCADAQAGNIRWCVSVKISSKVHVPVPVTSLEITTYTSTAAGKNPGARIGASTCASAGVCAGVGACKGCKKK